MPFHFLVAAALLWSSPVVVDAAVYKVWTDSPTCAGPADSGAWQNFDPKGSCLAGLSYKAELSCTDVDSSSEWKLTNYFDERCKTTTKKDEHTGKGTSCTKTGNRYLIVDCAPAMSVVGHFSSAAVALAIGASFFLQGIN
mmetsp:Transcript_35449/g.69517  ORF Transcript_35449/g.69517 Transcript_35449/m.69517 type:complete len:140 (-) Transcript_35449:59-478(-)|eukprot:CAMPEP_0175142742 /NCGR_PEP_ID=MMETSP0087-20121206/12996_1 /TAXON_ID=136419 /ORGANISM="Unknown Unknown, Strain D1" /LENGTH=139 /DNA_ID=CAMNT_0016426635 /DNA_START=29 /DNA_END=448 /DNA_ORIENTATION=-